MASIAQWAIDVCVLLSGLKTDGVNKALQTRRRLAMKLTFTGKTLQSRIILI